MILAVLVLLSTSCVTSRRDEVQFTLTPLIITSTLPMTQTVVPTGTMTPPAAQPTATQTPVEGTTSTQVNVRSEPSTASSVLGIVAVNIKVEITGKDPGENWWQINYPQGQGIDGKGWVMAKYITTNTKPDVPVVGGKADPNHANSAIVQQQLNVRSGPGTDFNSLGTLNPRDAVELIGKDANGAWLEINFESGPQGKGWVNAAFVQTQGVENLPIITETGLILGTGTPTSMLFTPTPTLVPAWQDQDSAISPVASVIFELTGTQAFMYNGNVSSPQGDLEDWVAFKPDVPLIFANLECKGSNLLRVEITENNTPTNLKLACGDQMKQISVNVGASYLVHLQLSPSMENLQYTNYTLTIKTRPT
jgi:uncharacterized protein YraI